MRQIERATLDYVALKLDDFLGAARDEITPCAVFRGSAVGYQPFSEEQKRAIRIYVDSWIREPLQAVLNGLDGDRSYGNDEHLRSCQRGLHDRPSAEELRVAYRLD